MHRTGDKDTGDFELNCVLIWDVFFTLLFMLVCSLDLTFRVLERETARDYFERRRRSHAPPGLPSLLRPAAPARLVPTEVQGCSYAAQPGAQPEQPGALAVAS